VLAAGSTRKIVGHLRGLRLGLLILLAGLSGCGSGTDVVQFSQAEKNLGFIAMAYSDFHSKHGRGPKDAEELKPFLKVFGNAEELLVSPNDGQAFVVVWGADPTRGGPTLPLNLFPILAYERKGKGGKRAIGDIRGHTMLIPEEDLAKLTFVGQHRPSAN
jgi:hypothetical protein